MLHILEFIHSHYSMVFLCRNRPRRIHFTLDDHLDCSQFGVPENNAAMNNLLYALWCVHFGTRWYIFLLDINLGVDLLVLEYTYPQF